jgi:hypothetical protein
VERDLGLLLPLFFRRLMFATREFFLAAMADPQANRVPIVLTPPDALVAAEGRLAARFGAR